MKNYLPGILLLNFLLLNGFIYTAVAQDKTITYPYDASYIIEDRKVELTHLDANLTIKPFDTLVLGKAEFSFRVLCEILDSLVFSVPELTFNEIRINDTIARYKLRGTDVVVYPLHSLGRRSGNTILFDYRVKPTDGLYFVGWNDPNQIKRKQAWAHRPNHWLPYTAGIITVDMAVTVDDRYKVMTNGARESVDKNADHTQTWHYKMNHPHPFFSTCLVIGDYDFISLQTKRGLPLEQWYYPDWKDHVEPTYRYMPEMFDFFEDEFGLAYPWELYREAPVIDYMYGAMETTTSTIFGDYLMVDGRGFLGRNYVNVNAHELAHQWFGNYISHLKGKDVWLTESFATYYAKKFEQHIFGDDYYQAERNKELAETFEAATHDNYGVGHSAGGRNRWYPKGSLVLDMLRDVLGEKEFKAAVKLYLESFPYQTAETSDFLQAIRKATGRSLEWFFEEWIYRGGEPSYHISYEQVTNAAGKAETRISVSQVQETNDITGLFRMPVSIEVDYIDGSKERKTQWISEKYEEIIIPNLLNKPIDFVLFDPNRKIIKKLKFDRSYEELIAQAMKAEHMIDRYDALLAMKDFPLAQKKGDLIKCYQRETFHLPKGEIIAQLADDNSQETVQLIIQAINDTNDKVRLVVLQNLKTVPPELKKEYEKFLKDPAFLNVELALDNLCNSFPGERKRYLQLTRDELGWRGLNIRIKWLEIAIGSGDKKLLRELTGYTGESYEFETRINAVNTLKRLNIMNEEVIRNLAKGITHWNYKIRNANVDCLKYFLMQNQYRSIIDRVFQDEAGPAAKQELEKIRQAL